MPVYHYTFHAYRSWNTDHPRGWVQRGEPGIRRTNVPLAYVRDRLATDLPVAFSEEEQQFLVRACVTGRTLELRCLRRSGSFNAPACDCRVEGRESERGFHSTTTQARVGLFAGQASWDERRAVFLTRRGA